MYLFTLGQSVPFNHFSQLQYLFPSTIKHIGGRQVVQRLMISLMVVIADKLLQMLLAFRVLPYCSFYQQQ